MLRYCPLSQVAASLKFFAPLVIPSLIKPWDSSCPMPKAFPIAMSRLIIYILRYFMGDGIIRIGILVFLHSNIQADRSPDLIAQWETQ